MPRSRSPDNAAILPFLCLVCGVYRKLSRVLECQPRKLHCKGLASDESGAVKVDWVVLTAAAVGLSLAAVASMRIGNSGLGQGVQTTLANAPVATQECLGGLCEPVYDHLDPSICDPTQSICPVEVYPPDWR
jgi:hypothetical protein